MAGEIKKGSNRAKAQPFIEGFAARGYSANRALKELQKMGLGYRRTDFLADYRKALGKEKAKDVGKYIRRDRYPTEASIVSDNRDWRRNYNHMVVYDIQDKDTGVIERKHIYVSSDELRTRGTIENEAVDIISTHLDSYNSSLVGVMYLYTVKGR